MSHMVEKPGDNREVLGARLAESGVSWLPLRYHRRPPARERRARHPTPARGW